MQLKQDFVSEALFALQDPAYRDFQRKLIPTIPSETVIGVRTPALRAYAKSLLDSGEAERFLDTLPHRYYDENNLHDFCIEPEKDFYRAMERTEAFLPYVDNWATCDLLAPKAFSRHLPELYEKILHWLQSDRVYTIRFGVGMLMRHFLGEAFQPQQLQLVADIRSEAYYVNMMVAWYFATALCKQQAAALPFIEEKRLPAWTHNKAIQKSVESRRIDHTTKAYLKTLKLP